MVKNDAFAFPRYVTSVEDLVHEWTAPVNREFNENKAVRDWLIGASSLGIDLLYVFLFWSIARHRDALSLKATKAVCLTYAVRYSIQHAFFLPNPEGLVWERPHFSSFGVPGGEVPSLTIYYVHI
jgi:hypothetical protein